MGASEKSEGAGWEPTGRAQKSKTARDARLGKGNCVMADTTGDIRAQKPRRISYPGSRRPRPRFSPVSPHFKASQSLALSLFPMA